MYRVDFTTGGHPFKIDDLNYIQQNVLETFSSTLNAICGPYGNSGVILDGVVFSGGPFPTPISFTGGSVYYQGNVYKIISATLFPPPSGQQWYWQTQELILPPSPTVYQNSITQNVHKGLYLGNIVAPIGSPPPNSFPIHNVVRYSDIQGDPIYTVKEYANPSAYNTLFDGTGKGLPNTSMSAYMICNGGSFNNPIFGTVTTPDLRGKFIVGQGQAASVSIGDINPTYSFGSTGGENTHLLTSGESGLPAHTHSGAVNALQANAAGGYVYAVGGGSVGINNANPPLNINAITAQNASQRHENRPPYYALYYIMKVY